MSDADDIPAGNAGAATAGDDELVVAACAGDRAAFGALIARYGLVVHGLCASLVDAERAGELAHEAFVEAWLRLESLRDPARFAGWLRRLTVNLCRMWLRQRQRRRAHEVGVDSLEADELAVPASTGVDLDGLLAGLEQLSDDHRLTLALHYWQGLTGTQIAAFLDVSEGTVMSRLHRARARLRERMQTMTSEPTGGANGADPFRAAVDGEIDVLLQLWQADTDGADSPGALSFSAAGQRLSELSRTHPDVVRPVLATLGDTLVRHIGLLLNRAGARAVGVAVACAFDDAQAVRGRARQVLRAAISKGISRSHESFARLPVRYTLTFLLDALFRSSQSQPARAELLVEVLPGCEDDASLILAATALRCCGSAGFDRLLCRWHAEVDRNEPDPTTLAALGRFGPPFFAAMSQLLAEETTPRRLQAVLAALETASGYRGGAAIFRDPQPPSDLDLRIAGRLHRDEVGQATLAGLLDRLAALLRHSEATVRDRAIALIGQFDDGQRATCLLPYLQADRPQTRLAAVSALRDTGDRGCIAQLMEIARHDPEASVRRLALQGLGSLRAVEARALLVELIDDPAVAPQAISALGTVGGDEAHRILDGLLHAADKRVARMASTALFGGQRTPRPPSQLRRQRLAKIRGADARPPLHKSVLGAIRHLPEMRPYPEAELTRLIGEVCQDYSTTRRELVMGSPGLMVRRDGNYELSESGRAVWRVERYLRDHDPRIR